MLHDVLIYRRGRKERRGGLRDVCELVCVEAGRMRRGRNTRAAGGLFLVTGSGSLMLTPSVKLLRCSVRCGSDTETEE